MTDAQNSESKSSGIGKTSVLMEAESIINGQRRQDYGSVTESFGNVAGLWTEYLERHAQAAIASAQTKYQRNDAMPITVISLSPEDVANLMILMKVSRAQNGFHRDSYVDIAGYAGCAEKLQDERRS